MASVRMNGLADFRFGQGIVADEVWMLLDLGDGDDPHMVCLPKDEALALATERELCLIQSGLASDGEPPLCHFGKVQEPVAWEDVVREADPTPDVDERLWFDAPCGGRDFLLDGSPHTFLGRMNAWCPAKKISYRVSRSEMGAMSVESTYFVRGFLSGNEPSPPEDANGSMTAADRRAWLVATERFRLNGMWGGGFSTCEECGRVLIPGGVSDCCENH